MRVVNKLMACSLFASLMLAGCNNGVDNANDTTASRTMPEPVSAMAISRHFVEVRFAGSIENAEGLSSFFRIEAADGSGALQVNEATVAPDKTRVFLSTREQEPRTYRLSLQEPTLEGIGTTAGANSGDTAPLNTAGGIASGDSIFFTGSTSGEPTLVSAVALNSSTVLLTFSEPLNKLTAEQAGFYRILDPDGNPDIDISVLSATLGPDGTTVEVQTTPQGNTEYTIQVTNVDAAYQQGVTCQGENVQIEGTPIPICAAEVRPSNIDGFAAPLVMTARSRIDQNDTENPEATGETGHVYAWAGGAGVRRANCNGSSTISGSSSDRDEELTFTFDVPMQKEAISISFTDLNFTSDTPVLFVSDISSATFDYVITEAQIQAAFTPTANNRGTVNIGLIAGIPSYTLIDAIRYRETASSSSIGGLCLSTSRRLDPTANTAVFYGIPPLDINPPTVTLVEAVSSTRILVSFSEPLREGSANPANFSISPAISILGAEADVYGTQIALTTLPLAEGTNYTLTVQNVQDLAGNTIASTTAAVNNQVNFLFPGTAAFDEGDAPRVVGAISTSHTSVVVTFSKRMGDSAESMASYSIVREGTDPAGGLLTIDGAAFVSGSNRTAVELSTFPQDEVLYLLKVVNVRDLQGNQLAPEELLVDPTSTTFVGTQIACPICNNGSPGLDGNGTCQTDDDCDDDAPCNPAEQDCEGTCVNSCASIDTDGDGLSDSREQNGWVVTVFYANGDQSSTRVTSNPLVADTDDDCVNDADELAYGSNPRSSDTDGDTLSDCAELNEWFSDPWNQDSDGDSLPDNLDVFFRVSPVLADTDGDQISDDEEILERNRNPLIADLPVPQIVVDELRFDINILTSYTDEEGIVQSFSDTRASTFTQSQTTSLGFSDTTSTQSENEFGQSIAAEGGTSGWKVSGEVSASQSIGRGYSSTVDQQSSQTSQQENQQSVTNALEQSENRSITRDVTEALVQATVNISNQSDISFSVTNIELSILQQDRLAGLTFRPIATLRPTGADDPTDQPTFNIGPFDQRGPIIFESTTVFPNLIDDLMREPTGLIIEVANFDILDEFERNLVFTSQEVQDRTAGITIDFGDGVVENYRVATTSKFDGNTGIQLGITMERALEIIGILKDADGSADDDDTYETIQDTRPGNVTVEALTRVRNVANSMDGQEFWTAISSNIRIDENQDFSTLPLKAGDDILILYTSDRDMDNLLAREEYLYNSSDDDTDSDDDGLLDFDEVRTGWTVMKLPGLPYKTFPSPARADSDLDGLEDPDEMTAGTDPNRSDTDFDGLSDASELRDTFDIELLDRDTDPFNNPILTQPPYSDQSIRRGANNTCDTTTATGDDEVVTGVDICIASGANGIIDTTPAGDDEVVAAPKIAPGPDGICDTTTASGDDVVEFADASMPPTFGSIGTVCISAGPDGEINTDPQDDDFLRVVHVSLFTTDPLNEDTDRDGIGDGRELVIGINPNSSDAGKATDTDNDGLFDNEEDACGSDKNLVDTDFDGIPDVIECSLGFDPLSRDGDGDTLRDYFEFDSSDAAGLYDISVLDDALQLCIDAPSCFYDPPNSFDLIGTDPSNADTDGDTVNDNIEVSVGWTVAVFNAPPYQVMSDPTQADKDGDGLNDADEQANGTDPNLADTDGDLRNDGDEITGGFDPLRKDFNLQVTLTTVDVIDDCDAATCEGLELIGQFKITKPDGSEETLVDQGCSTEECACEVQDCCDAQKCPGEAFVYNASTSFSFSDGQSFTLFTNTLQDNDELNCNLGNLLNNIGSASNSFNFSTSFQTSASQNVGSGNCEVKINYVFVIQ
ncbi:MAG: hypothetical protein ACPGXK_05545 [Phycisphaerae bacterium]